MENKTICPVCGQEKKINHKYCSKACQNINTAKNVDYTKRKQALSDAATLRYLKANGEKKDYNVKCNNCDKEFSVNEPEFKHPLKEKYYCSISCANSRDASYTQTDDFRKKMSDASKELWKNQDYYDRCIANLNSNYRFQSKGEKIVRNYFKAKYPEDQWTSGPGLRYKDLVFCRDMYSNVRKICFEYDGIWHFENIKNQLKNKQMKDALLEEWCLENDYRLIRIRDEIFINNPNFYLIEIEKIFYESSEQIVKIFDMNLITPKHKRKYTKKSNLLL